MPGTSTICVMRHCPHPKTQLSLTSALQEPSQVCVVQVRVVQVRGVSDAYRSVHGIVPQTTACVQSLHERMCHHGGQGQSQDDDCGAGAMPFWAGMSPVHVSRGTLRSRLLAPESIPESMPSVDMPSVESYEPSSLPASQDGLCLLYTSDAADE